MGGLGFFGKVPSKGDFVGAGLPSSFIDPWDGWTRKAIAHGRARLGERWQTVFLSCPVWRFALAPGICGGLGWAGVIASSVDGVGRPYPLTIATMVPAETSPMALMSSWATGFERMIDLSLLMQGLDSAAVAEANAAALALDAIPFPPSPPVTTGAVMQEGQAIRIGPVPPGSTLSARCAPAFVQAGARCSVMWRLGWGLPGAAIVGCGLPDPSSTLTMWEAEG